MAKHVYAARYPSGPFSIYDRVFTIHHKEGGNSTLVVLSLG